MACPGAPSCWLLSAEALVRPKAPHGKAGAPGAGDSSLPQRGRHRPAADTSHPPRPGRVSGRRPSTRSPPRFRPVQLSHLPAPAPSAPSWPPRLLARNRPPGPSASASPQSSPCGGRGCSGLAGSGRSPRGGLIAVGARSGARSQTPAQDVSAARVPALGLRASPSRGPARPHRVRSGEKPSCPAGSAPGRSRPQRWSAAGGPGAAGEGAIPNRGSRRAPVPRPGLRQTQGQQASLGASAGRGCRERWLPPLWRGSKLV